MIKQRSIRTVALLALLLAAAQATHAAEVDVTLSRASIAVGEPVMLTLSRTGSTPLRPDLSPLEEDFSILERASVTDVSEINGRRQERQSLRLTLLPLHEGHLGVPSLEVNGSMTEPLSLEVSATQSTGPSTPGASVARGATLVEPAQPARNIEIAVSARPQRVVIGQQVIIRALISGDGPLPPGRLIEPGMNQFDVLPLGEERRVVPASDVGKSGQRWEYERRYAFFPHHVGTLEVPPLRYSAWAPGADTPTHYDSESFRIEVSPAPADPPGAPPDLPWLPANAVSLSEAGASSVRVAPGQMIERVVTMKAVGLRAEHLPALQLAVPYELQAHTDPPRLWNLRGPDGVTGFRSERVSISTAKPGSYRLPEAVINWWNVDSGEWARAASPEWQLEVAALDSASRRPAPDWRRQPTPEGSPGAAESPEQSDARAQPRGLLAHWPWLLGTLTALLAGLLIWSGWRTRRQGRVARRAPPPSARYGPPEQAPEVVHPPEQKAGNDALDKVASAYRAANAARARQALLDWASGVWAEDPPGNLWQLSRRLPDPLADDIRKLDKAFFSPTPIAWHAAPLAQQLAEFVKNRDDQPAVD